MEMIVIDWSRVEELRNDMGHEGFDEVVDLFLEEMDERITIMRTANSRNRSEDLHFLKGCAANVGFIGLHKVCSQAELDDAFELKIVLNCYDDSKVEFLSSTNIHITQIKTPDNTSSSVISR